MYRISNLVPADYVLALRPPGTSEAGLLLAMLAANPAVAPDLMTMATMTGHGDPEGDRRVRGYAAMFYPAAAVTSQATRLSLSAEEERTGIDFHVKASRVFRVSGNLRGGPVGGFVIRLLPADPETDNLPWEIATAVCDDEGHFAFDEVPPGLVPPRGDERTQRSRRPDSFAAGGIRHGGRGVP